MTQFQVFSATRRAAAQRLLTAVFLFTLFAAVAHAETLTVTRTDDRDATCNPNDCSLREAIGTANAMTGDDVVVFDLPSPATITLSEGALEITSNMRILGPGMESPRSSSLLTVTAAGSSRLFSVVGVSLNVFLGGFRLTGGNGGGVSGDGHGGAIYHQGGSSTLRLEAMTIENNTTGANNDGGAVFSIFGSLQVNDSTIAGNTATRSGGGIYFEGVQLTVTSSTLSGNAANGSDDFGGGGILSEDPTTLVNSTFSGNSSAYAGGGVNFSTTSTKALTIRNCTFTGNTALYGGGLFHQEGNTTIANSILALNTATGIPSSNNIYTAGTLTQFSNYTGATPMLNALADNGGPTQTHSLQVGSPAINAGTNGQALGSAGEALLHDQRGSLSARITAGTVDIGAFESGSFAATAVTVTRSDDRDASCTVGDCSLREAVALANATPGDEVIYFSTALAGQTINLTDGSMDITTNVIISGPGQSTLTVDANSTGRIFTVSGAGVRAGVSGLTLTGGNGGGVLGDGHGGAILQQGSGSVLTLDAVTIEGNTTGANNDGGAIFTQFGSLVIRRSTIRANTATRTGGAVYFEGTALTVRDSTFAGNASNGNEDQGGGAIYSEDATTIINSTFSGNSSQYGGGAVNFTTTSVTPLTIRQSTFTGNSALYGGAIFHQEGATVVANSILSLNTASAIPSSANFYTAGGLTVFNNYTGAAPLLAPLANYGGITPTHGLYCSSPALSAGSGAQALDESGSPLITDQRGFPFVRSSSTVDAGAFEAQPCFLLPPPSFEATGTSTTLADLTWGAVTGATTYEIYRTANINTAYSFVTSTASLSSGDATVSPNTTYLYKVRAVAGNNVSEFSADLATTRPFTDPVLSVGSAIKAVHITELRIAVNAMRAAANLTPAVFTDPGLAAGFSFKRLHIIELRNALTPAAAALGYPLPPLTDPVITVNVTPFKLAHVVELRDGVD